MDLADLKEFLAHPRHDGWRVPGAEAVSLDGNHLVVRLEVTKELRNFGGTLHGGAAATLIDSIGSLAIFAADRDGRFGVSTDMNVSWLAPVPVGEWVTVDATVLRSGRNLAFVSVEIRRESDGVLAVQGRMTKSLSTRQL
jgi:acyl-coenzyme A thioesterase 13